MRRHSVGREDKGEKAKNVVIGFLCAPSPRRRNNGRPTPLGARLHFHHLNVLPTTDRELFEVKHPLVGEDVEFLR